MVVGEEEEEKEEGGKKKIFFFHFLLEATIATKHNLTCHSSRNMVFYQECHILK